MRNYRSYALDMLDDDGNAILERARMTEDQARRVGGSDTVLGAGHQET
jgi:hypothetical protein